MNSALTCRRIFDQWWFHKDWDMRDRWCDVYDPGPEISLGGGYQPSSDQAPELDLAT